MRIRYVPALLTLTLLAACSRPSPPAAPAKTPAPPPVPVAAPASKPAPPAKTAYLPKLEAEYRKVRGELLAHGFRPARAAPPECRGPEPSVDACWGSLVEFPEIEACSGTGMGFCIGWWLAPDGRVLRIQTAGEPDLVYDRRWATPGEIAELPKGWRP